MKNKSGYGFKNTVLFIALILTSVFILIFSSLIYTTQNSNFKKTTNEFEHILKKSVEYTIDETIELYTTRANTILNTTEAKELLKAEKRDELYSMMERKWKLWTSIEPQLKIILFHRADGTVFLRMHKPKMYDDYLSDIRPMVKAAHEQKVVLTGYETGKFSTVFRILTPIFYEGEYIGSLDFGINPNHFVEEVYKFTGHEGVLFIKEDNLKLFKRDSSLSISGYKLQTIVSKDVNKLIQSLPTSYDFKEHLILDVYGSKYSTYSHAMYDYKKNTKAILLFFNDFTDSAAINDKFNLILISTSILFFILMYILLNQSLNKLLLLLENMHNRHELILKKAHEDTVFNENFLNTVLDTDQNIVITTIDKEILYSANKTFLDFTSCKTVEEFNQKYDCVSELFIESDDKEYLSQDKDGMHWIDYIYKNPLTAFKVKMKKGEKVYTFLVNANKMLLDNIDRNVFSFTDISQIIEYQEIVGQKDALLFKQSKMAAMGEMISMIAHQWRQPLATIASVVMNLRMLIEFKQYNEKAFIEELASINEYVQYMSKTIDDFRNFYKPNKQKESVILKDVIETSLSVIESSLRTKNIKTTVDIQTIEPITCYKNELIQVILNLIKNAQDVLVEGNIEDAAIGLSVVKNSEESQSIIIWDNGDGISEDIIDKIFDPYFSTKDEKNGTGLGLYMSKIILEDHSNATIDVENDNGAKFTITLPV